MPDMPSAFYVPAIGALCTVIIALWRLILAKDEKLVAQSNEQTRILTLNSEALRANTYALESVALYVQEAAESAGLRRARTSGSSAEGGSSRK